MTASTKMSLYLSAMRRRVLAPPLGHSVELFFVFMTAALFAKLKVTRHG